MAGQGEGGDAQRIIDGFVEGMVAGREIRMLSAGEGLVTARVQLDPEITVLTVQRKGAEAREWLLDAVCGISVGEAGGGPALDELCVTLASEEGARVSFRFADMEERDTFALCLGMFVDNLRGGQEQELESEPGDYEDEGYEDANCASQVFQPDVASAVSAAQSAGAEAPGLTEAQRLVKAFVQQMVRGREVDMLSTHGGSLNCLVSLDRDLTEMIIQRSQSKDGKKRVIPLRNIQHIAVGTDAEEEVELPVDELCVALLLQEGRVLAFRFGDVEERDTFALCLGIFVDGNRKKGSRLLQM